MLKGAVTFVKGRSLKGAVVGVRERMGLSFRSDDDFLFQNIYRRKEIVVHVHCRLFFFTKKGMIYGPKCLAVTWTNQLTLRETRML